MYVYISRDRCRCRKIGLPDPDNCTAADPNHLDANPGLNEDPDYFEAYSDYPIFFPSRKKIIFSKTFFNVE